MIYTSNRLQAGMREAVETLRPRVMVTLVLNRETNLLVGTRCCLEFGRRLERRTHGKNWARYPKELRFSFYAFPEHMLSNFHYHVLLVGPPNMCEAAIEHGNEIWRKLTETGHAHVDWFKNQRAAARYCVKAVKHVNAFENVVVYAPR